MTTTTDQRGERSPDLPTFVVGDIHGQYDSLITLLRAASLVDGNLRWCGGDAELWFVGDFFDRGPDGIAVVKLVMRLQQDAPRTGGRVASLLGNHEPLLLGVRRFGTTPGLTTGPGGNFVADWERNGGMARDLETLTPEIEAWLTDLPAITLVRTDLLLHADALFYREYGESIGRVNEGIAAVLHGSDPAAWDRLLDQFSERDAFSGVDGPDRARDILRTFGGAGATRVIHGHTPITRQSGESPKDVSAPYSYADGLCVNVDGGMYLGGPGFVFRL